MFLTMPEPMSISSGGNLFLPLLSDMNILNIFHPDGDIVLYGGSCLDLLSTIPSETIKLIVTSPPYNLGKEYEKKTNLEYYVEQQREVINECYRVLREDGSICWQVGNFVNNGEIVPIDSLLYPVFNALGLKLRNRIIWNFEHGLHCKNRFSGRYETINWFTKSDNYTFNLDPIRVPQKYPQKKHFKGPNAGKLSCNPLGKNPGDVWNIPNVKNNHIEKTIHPCQFPVELVERLVLSMSNENDWILDPFLGVGTTIIASIKNRRKSAGAEIHHDYLKVAEERIRKAINGELKTRPMNKPVYDPDNPQKSLQYSDTSCGLSQLNLFDNKISDHGA
jgi:adenine-specific DNA-methyltransferase